MKKFITIDVDGVLTDGFHDKLISFYNERTKGSPLVITELHEDIREYFKNGDVPWKEGREYVLSEGFVLSFEPRKDALEFISNLRKENIPFKICTAPYVGAKLWMGERAEWLKEHFQMEANDIIFARDKSVVASLSLIDDKISNCADWSKENGAKTAFLISQPWNENPKDFDRCIKLEPEKEWYYSDSQNVEYQRLEKSVIRTNDFNYILKKIKKRFFNG